MVLRVVVSGRRPDGRSLWWRVPLALVVWLLLALPLAAAIVAVVTYAHYARGLPEVPDLAAFAAAAPRSTVILAADGTVLADLPFTVGRESGRRVWRSFEELPPLMVHALLAAEDVRFFAHDGVDLRAVARAALANYRAGHTVEGASTITQQVARNLLPEDIGRERSLRRKLREMILARRLERRWSKPAILETYANLVFLGANAYGVEAAARAYFGRSLDTLSLAQAALVAGMAQAPGRTNPFLAPEAARARRDEVLERMARAGFVSAAEAAVARAEPLALAPAADRYGTVAPWLTERARRELESGFPEAYARGGLVVQTTAQPVLDDAATAAARAGASALATRQKSAVPEVAAVAIDHTTGYVEILVGGLDWQRSRFDRALQACRQPGSTFKPIVYAAALEKNVITPGTPLRDAPVTEYDEDRDVYWKPNNSGHAFRGVALAQDALAASLNAPSVDVMDRIGPAAAIAFAQRLGFTSTFDAVRPLVLGASCVIPLELAGAFGVFAAGGVRVEPIVITRVAERGVVLLDRAAPEDPFLAPDRRLDRFVARLPRGAGTRVVDAGTAYLVASMLAEAAHAGTGHDARAAGRPVAGKTGTTNESSDAWFVGWTGRLVTTVWVGHDDPATKLGKREDGAHAALPIWVALVRLAESTRPARAVPGDPPPGIVTAIIDRESGKLARPGAGGAILLPFRAGTVPGESVDEARDLPRDLDDAARNF
jgi:penicillin-binding protein 1A